MMNAFTSFSFYPDVLVPVVDSVTIVVRSDAA